MGAGTPFPAHAAISTTAGEKFAAMLSVAVSIHDLDFARNKNVR